MRRVSFVNILIRSSHKPDIDIDKSTTFETNFRNSELFCQSNDDNNRVMCHVSIMLDEHEELPELHELITDYHDKVEEETYINLAPYEEIPEKYKTPENIARRLTD